MSPTAGSTSSPTPPPTEGVRRLGFGLYAAALFTVFGIALSNGLLLLAVLALPWTGRGRWRRLEKGRDVLLLVGLYLFFTAVSVLASPEPWTSFAGAQSDLLNLAPLPLALLLVGGERGVRRILDGLVVVAVLVAAVALFQVPGPWTDVAGWVDLDQRIRGPFSHYMTLAGFLLLVDLVLLASLLMRPAARTPWRWGALLLLNLTLLINQSRNAWVALVVVAAALLLLRGRRWLWACLPLAVALVLLAPVPLVHRMVSVVDLEDPSNYDRLAMLEAGLDMIAERPVTGLGPEMVEERYPVYRPPTAPRYQRPHLHNSYLQIAAERGLPTLLAHCAWMALALTAAWRGFRREGGIAGPRADLWLGSLAALAAFLLAGLFEHNWGDTEVQRIALFLAAVPFCLHRGEGWGEGGGSAKLEGAKTDPGTDHATRSTAGETRPLPQP